MKGKSGGKGGSPSLAIELKNVSKTFGTVLINRNINLKVEKGSIHGIVGENGAGKSTLMNILYGLHVADSGEIFINGTPAKIRSSADAIGLGIGKVHQHFMLGSEESAFLSDSEQVTLKTLEQLSQKYGMDVDPQAVIEDLPVGIRQRVEIIKAIKGGADILILDKPTGVLTPQKTSAATHMSEQKVFQEYPLSCGPAKYSAFRAWQGMASSPDTKIRTFRAVAESV